MSRKKSEPKVKPPFTAQELQVLRSCIEAHRYVEGGIFLPSPGRQKAAKSLIERGFLTPGDAPGSGEKWITVRITQAQLDAAHATVARRVTAMDKP